MIELAGRSRAFPQTRRRPKMKKDQKQIRIELTEEQKRVLREQTGRDAEAISFTVEELEERIAPIRFYE